MPVANDTHDSVLFKTVESVELTLIAARQMQIEWNGNDQQNDGRNGDEQHWPGDFRMFARKAQEEELRTWRKQHQPRPQSPASMEVALSCELLTMKRERGRSSCSCRSDERC